MTDRYPVDLSALPPDQAEIVRVFAAALRQVREEETKMLRLSLYKLELLRAGMAELNADLRAVLDAAGARGTEPLGSRPAGL
jgi:hypothetical protein